MKPDEISIKPVGNFYQVVCTVRKVRETFTFKSEQVAGKSVEEFEEFIAEKMESRLNEAVQ